MYKDKITEIESLKKQKEEIFANINKSEKEAEKQNRIQEEYLKNLEKKSNEFKVFMEQRGKAALEYVIYFVYSID